MARIARKINFPAEIWEYIKKEADEQYMSVNQWMLTLVVDRKDNVIRDAQPATREEKQEKPEPIPKSPRKELPNLGDPGFEEYRQEIAAKMPERPFTIGNVQYNIKRITELQGQLKDEHETLDLYKESDVHEGVITACEDRIRLLEDELEALTPKCEDLGSV